MFDDGAPEHPIEPARQSVEVPRRDEELQVSPKDMDKSPVPFDCEELNMKPLEHVRFPSMNEVTHDAETETDSVLDIDAIDEDLLEEETRDQSAYDSDPRKLQ